MKSFLYNFEIFFHAFSVCNIYFFGSVEWSLLGAKTFGRLLMGAKKFSQNRKGSQKRLVECSSMAIVD